MPLPAVLPRYRRLKRIPWGTRLFLLLRWRLTPYAAMAGELPVAGLILDLGCGHGLLSIALASDAPARQVRGIDHDEERIRVAREAGQGIQNLELLKGSLLDPPPGPYHGIVAIDVLHYFEPGAQERILKRAHEDLFPGGTLLVREVNREGGLAAKFNRFYEKIATRTGFTRSEREDLHFRPAPAWTELLRGIGFEVVSRPCSHLLFADVLYVCRKN